MAALQALLALSQTPQGQDLIEVSVRNQLETRAVRDQNGLAIAYVNRFAHGTILVSNVPAEIRMQPTVNITADQQRTVQWPGPRTGPEGLRDFLVSLGVQAPWAVRAASGGRSIGVHMLFAVDKYLNHLFDGREELRRCLQAGELDTSHLFQPTDFNIGFAAVGDRVRALDCCFESHAENMDRIACSVFARRFGGGCICSAGGHDNHYKPRCRSFPNVERATVNGIQI